MRRRFNTTGFCNPQRHYMVNLSERLRQIREAYVDEGSYFVINRGRQYGKTTTLRALEDYLKEDYIVISLDFQEIATEDFTDAAAFARAYSKIVLETFETMGYSGMENFLQPLAVFAEEAGDKGLKELFVSLSKMCAKAQRPIVLIIDEVDSATRAILSMMDGLIWI